MTSLVSLLSLDLLRIRNWFRSYLGTKMIVLAGFVGVLGLVIAVEFLLALSFFRLTATQDRFGQAVAQYSINAALLLLFLIGIVSSIASSTATLYRSQVLRHLLTLPITTTKIFVTRQLTSLLHSTWLTVILLTPIMVAYGLSFSPGIDFVLRSLAILILLTTASQAIGGGLTVILVRRFGGLSHKSLITLFTFAITGSLVLMRFLFPPAFFRLYFAEDWPSFQHQLGQLPLLSTSLPTNWLAGTLTHGWSLATGWALAGTIVLIAALLRIGTRYYLSSWRVANEGRFLAGRSGALKTERVSYPRFFGSTARPLLVNELIAILRSPTETSYVAFLTGLSVVLLFMLRSVPALEQAAPQLLPAVYTLSLIGLSYLMMTVSARFVYPLIAKEKRSAWFLFSVPLRREQVLKTKAIFALVVASPMLLLAPIAAAFMHLPLELRPAYVALAVISAVTVSLLALLLGTIAPNFTESENPEATSTSGSGLVAIGLSLLYISLAGYEFYMTVVGSLGGVTASGLLAALSVLWLISLMTLARRNLHRYDL